MLAANNESLFHLYLFNQLSHAWMLRGHHATTEYCKPSIGLFSNIYLMFTVKISTECRKKYA